MQQILNCLVVSIFFTNGLFAQFGINGKIVDAKNQALPFVNILLQNAQDSSFITGTITDTAGNFTLTTSKIGRVRVAASSIGYNDYVTETLLLDAANPIQNLGPLTLTENITTLKAVEITGSTPIFEQKIDRIVLNIGDKISTAGATVLDILERSPGVVVDRSSGSLGMLGKQGVNVMINGKLNYMPPDALMSYLQRFRCSQYFEN